ncbi:GtrA family protein [Aurantimonas sp. A3-2-R12]|uniref:GtrA family protein n=1 Tax=Aurantimonas sp. A3-2-R12 TaxID=3114362 RepID=UPI002E18A6BC|nr:GtrA family protein [Aurantimonas sp. A3-2-R12]
MKPRPPGKSRLLVETFRFVLVGAIGFVVNAGGVLLLHRHVGPVIAQLIAFPVAVTVTWWCNRIYTFAKSGRKWLSEWAHYVGANLVGWIVTNAVYVSLIISEPFFRENLIIALAIGAAAGLVLNFTASKWVVFRQQDEPDA